jgi:general secretion pathway protein A
MDYLAFFHLSDPPFGLSPDSTYFYPSKMHNDILASLDYAVTQKEGFSLVTGEPGVGKTMSLKVFMDRWQEKADIALILTPRLAPEEFLQAVLADLHIPLATTNKNEMIQRFRDFLLERSESGRRVIIIVDEAQNLPDGTLEELRLLSNLETEKEKLLQIILVGQPELRSRLHYPGLQQLDQRVTVRATLRPLSAEETSDYIHYRLVKAGKGTAIFDARANKAIYRFSRGIPRLINLVASRAMMVAFIDSSHQVHKEHVQLAIRHVTDEAAPRGNRHMILRYGLIGAVLLALVTAGVLFYSRYHSGPPQLAASISRRPQLQATTPAPVPEPSAVPASILTSNSIPQAVPPTPLPPATQDSKPGRAPTTKGTATITVAAARLRDQPSSNAEVIHKATEGDVFEVIDEWTQPNGNKWYKVRLPDGRDGWIASYIIHIDTPR